MPDERALRDCGRRPNCVSSTASNPRRRVGPWRLAVPAKDAWPVVLDEVAAMERTRIVEAEEPYLRAEARSRIFGFVDDLELLLDAQEEALAVRSAARVGYSDRGVNRRRVEALRSRLEERGVLAR